MGKFSKLMKKNVFSFFFTLDNLWKIKNKKIFNKIQEPKLLICVILYVIFRITIEIK